MPDAFEQLVETLERLEGDYRDLQDIEFTVEEGTLYLLQTRTGKRTAAAASRVAGEMVDEGLISREEAVARIDPTSSTSFCTPDDRSRRQGRGGRARAQRVSRRGVRHIVLDADTAEERGKTGENVILVRWETTRRRHRRADPCTWRCSRRTEA